MPRLGHFILRDRLELQKYIEKKAAAMAPGQENDQNIDFL